MSKIARALALVAVVAAMYLAAMTAIAQATDEPDGATAHGRLLLAEPRSSLLNLPSGAPTQADPAAAVHQRLLAQERYYSTWGYGNPATPAPPRPRQPAGGQAAWITPALGVLSGILALVAGVAVVAARRAHHRQRAEQTA